jgi:hypothetical protein
MTKGGPKGHMQMVELCKMHAFEVNRTLARLYLLEYVNIFFQYHYFMTELYFLVYIP